MGSRVHKAKGWQNKERISRELRGECQSCASQVVSFPAQISPIASLVPRETFRLFPLNNKPASTKPLFLVPHAKYTADLPLPAACLSLDLWTNQDTRISQKSGQPQFRPPLGSAARPPEVSRAPARANFVHCLVHGPGIHWCLGLVSIPLAS